jgi:hypothetical protein
MFSTNDLAAACAALIRDGWMSVASIDGETSITSITVARLRGTLASAIGPASAAVSAMKATRKRIGGTIRHRLGRFGATLSSTAMLANRTTCRRRRRDTQKYAPNTAPTPSRSANHTGDANESIPTGPS